MATDSTIQSEVQTVLRQAAWLASINSAQETVKPTTPTVLPDETNSNSAAMHARHALSDFYWAARESHGFDAIRQYYALADRLRGEADKIEAVRELAAAIKDDQYMTDWLDRLSRATG